MVVVLLMMMVVEIMKDGLVSDISIYPSDIESG
jgi:hypothetical protein